MIFYHGIGNVLKERRLAGAWRSDNESSLSLADRSHEIHHPCGESLGNGLQLDSLIGTNGGQFLKERDIHELLGCLTLDLGGSKKLGATGATAGLPLDEDTIPQVVLTNHFGSDEYVVLSC